MKPSSSLTSASTHTQTPTKRISCICVYTAQTSCSTETLVCHCNCRSVWLAYFQFDVAHCPSSSPPQAGSPGEVLFSLTFSPHSSVLQGVLLKVENLQRKDVLGTIGNALHTHTHMHTHTRTHTHAHTHTHTHIHTHTHTHTPSPYCCC